jgi:hypothetical protein
MTRPKVFNSEQQTGSNIADSLATLEDAMTTSELARILKVSRLVRDGGIPVIALIRKRSHVGIRRQSRTVSDSTALNWMRCRPLSSDDGFARQSRDIWLKGLGSSNCSRESRASQHHRNREPMAHARVAIASILVSRAARALALRRVKQNMAIAEKK